MKVVCGYDPGEPYRPWFGGRGGAGRRESGGGRSEVRERPPRRGGPAAHPEARHGGGSEGAPRLRLVQKIGVGVDTIDLVAAQRRGVAVANLPGTNTQAVAEAALMLMLAALRNLPGLDRECRVGNGWTPEQEAQERRNTLGELCGRTVGLVGAGAVASRLVGPLEGLGARVIYTDRRERPNLGIERHDLDYLLEASDVVSLHLPLTPETEGLIDQRALARMKPAAVLINTARGGLVEETALVEALTSGRLLAAGLDVLAEEPPPPDHPLLSLDNVVLTPHVAWLTQETLSRSFDVALENIRRLRDGRDLLFRVA
jgi:phosphoglycerate dehydrogenase-like enzyme